MNKLIVLIKSEEIVKSFKEAARVFLMAVIPLSIVQLQQGGFDWKPLIVAGLIALLRFIDKALHETGVSVKGITRF